MSPETALPNAKSSTAPPASVRIVVPLRSFVGAKIRLAERLDSLARARLAREMAESVVAAADHPVTIVTNATEVLSWASQRGLDVCSDPGSVNGAARAGVERARRLGALRVVVAHGDLPLVTSFEPVLSATEDVVVVPDRHDDGTPVLAVRTNLEFPFSYGPSSFRRHCAIALAMKVTLGVVRDEELGFDVDCPADLDALAAMSRTWRRTG